MSHGYGHKATLAQDNRSQGNIGTRHGRNDEEELVDRYKAQVKDGRRKKTTKKVSKVEDETGQFAVSFRKIMAPSLLTLWFPQ